VALSLAFRYGKGLVLPLLGRYGDVVSFNDLPRDFQTQDLAQQLGATAVGGGEFDGEESCGSPGETINDPSLDHQYSSWNYPKLMSEHSTGVRRQLDRNIQSGFRYQDGSADVWLNVVTYNQDQLRQRVAWALAQSHVIGEVGLGTTNEESEVWLVYHDIFVRNVRLHHDFSGRQFGRLQVSASACV
jgi:hypothetical protein